MTHLHENQSASDDGELKTLPPVLAAALPRMRLLTHAGQHEALTAELLGSLLTRHAQGLQDVDLEHVAERVLAGCYDGIPEAELDKLLVNVPAALIANEADYAFLAARLLHRVVEAEVQSLGVHSFSQSIALGHEQGIIGDETAAFVAAHAPVLDAAIEPQRSELFQYFGLRTVYDRYLLRHPTRRKVFETPQYFFLRVACGLSQRPQDAVEFYRLISSLEYLPSSPTLFNSGTRHSQMSSCYLLDSPADELEGIYKRYTDIARLSKFAGGIGVAWHRVRSRGSLIRGTNGKSNGIVPWLKTLDASVAAVNQGGRRKGACCVYLETWHPDIEEFLELRDNTGDEARRTHNLNLANWVPDLFMKRVQADQAWSLFDPKECPDLIDSFGDEFEALYTRYEAEGRAVRAVPARDLYSRMMRTLAQTGNGWMTFKDACNKKCNQTGTPGRVVHSSNLCTEIVEVTSQDQTAVCNLGSLNLARFVEHGEFNFEKLRAVVRLAVKYLDRVVDINYYPTPEAEQSNRQWRPVGLGLMGLQDVFFCKRLDFDGDEARQLSTRIQEEVYYAALCASADLAVEHGPHATFWETRAARGQLQFDLWGVVPGARVGGQLGLFSNGGGTNRWAELKARIMETGLRNSLLIAIAPTATIASIAGCYECIEPQVSNLFKRETLSGEFLQLNHYLAADLKRLGLWSETIRERIKAGEGSVQQIEEIPESLRSLYRTAWELPQRALIEMHADRSPYIDQSASLNLFLAQPTIGKLSSMYAHAWKRGLKTTYYLRSRPATSIVRSSAGQAGAGPGGPVAEVKKVDDAQAVACSLENPEYCESCQ